MAGRMVCTKEVSEELPSDLIEILHRCHAQMQLELAQWFNQSVPSDQATPSVCKADEYGCPETRISKSPNISKSVGDADEDFEKERVEPVRMSSRFSKNGSFCRGGSSTQQESAPRKSRWLHNDEVQLENLRKRGNGGESSDLRKERRPKRAHNIFRRCIENPWFDRFFAFMIIASSVAVGAEVEYSAQQLSNELPAIFTVLQISFFSAFLIELCIRMLAFRGSFFTSFDAGWNIFDTSVVFFSAVEVVVAYVFADNSFLTIVRTIRVVRFARIIRVVRFLRQLRVMVYTLFGTFPSLFWSMILMSIIMYLFSTMITQAVAEFLMLNQGTAEDQSRMRQVFGSTARTAYFLFQSVSGGTNWARDVELLFNLEIIYIFIFLLYVMVTAFALLNVVTGFFCESAIEMAAADREQMVVEMLREKDKLMKEFQHVFNEMDADNSGEIEFEELEEFLEHDSMQAYLSHLHISTSGAWNIFKLLDKDETGSVSIEEFVEGLLSLKGLSKTIDIAALQYDLKKLGNVWREFMEYAEKEFNKLEALCTEKPSK